MTGDGAANIVDPHFSLEIYLEGLSASTVFLSFILPFTPHCIEGTRIAQASPNPNRCDHFDAFTFHNSVVLRERILILSFLQSGCTCVMETKLRHIERSRKLISGPEDDQNFRPRHP